MSMGVGSRNGQSAEMNVTPLIDVLLVLIIIFMVVLPHHSLGEQAEIPQPAPADAHVLPPERTIVVELLDRGGGTRPGLKINDSEVSWDELAPRLKEIFRSRVQRVAFLKGDPDVEYEYVAQAVDLIRGSEAERVGLMPIDHQLRQ